MERDLRARSSNWLLLAPVLILLAIGCAAPQERAAREQARARDAKAAFDEITHDYNQVTQAGDPPSRDEFLRATAARYEQFLHQYPDQPVWAAQALRSLGNVRATQGQLDEAVRIYARVGKQYPQQEWEVLQAWKSAADLLGDAGRKAEAREFDRLIVARFDRPELPAIYQTIVRAAARRLGQVK